MMKSGIGESITKAQKEVGDCGTGAETPKDTRSGRTKCTRSHVTSQPKLQDKIPEFGKSEPDFWGNRNPIYGNRNRNGSPRAKLDVASTTGEGVADEFLIIR